MCNKYSKCATSITKLHAVHGSSSEVPHSVGNLQEVKANFDLALQMYWLHVAVLTLGTFWTATSTDRLRDIGNELHEINSKAEEYDAKPNYEEVKAKIYVREQVREQRRKRAR